MEPAVWRALAVFRALGLVYAVAVYVRRFDEYRHPVVGWFVLAAMLLWTLGTALAYRQAARRTWPLLTLDLLVAMAAVVVARFLDDPHRIAAGAQTLPVVWAAAPVLAFAVKGGWRAGLVGAGGVGLADLLHRGAVTVSTVNNIVLLFLAGSVVGYVVTLARTGAAALAEARAVEAATRERERLARDIHDSVLQVLAMVGRRGRSAGGDAAELGRLAAEQEQALRALVASAPAPTSAEATDLRHLLTAYSSSTVTVSTPGTAVLLGHTRAREVAAAVGAALANVAAHAGDGAHAWVLLEDEGDEVVVSVRDDGAGFAAGRLGAAAAEGRLGVSGSIEGRMRDLGGTAVVSSAVGQGTEVELRLPKAGS